LNRKCPNCSRNSISVSGMIVSDVNCHACGQLVGVHGIFRAVFFVIILAVTSLVAIVVLVDQGVYAALLMITVPIGAIGFIKARYCPLVSKSRKYKPQVSSNDTH